MSPYREKPAEIKDMTPVEIPVDVINWLAENDTRFLRVSGVADTKRVWSQDEYPDGGYIMIPTFRWIAEIGIKVSENSVLSGIAYSEGKTSQSLASAINSSFDNYCKKVR